MEKNLDIQAECVRFKSALAAWDVDDVEYLEQVAHMIYCISRCLTRHTCWTEQAEAIAKAIEEMRSGKIAYERDENLREVDHDELLEAAVLVRSMAM